MGSNIALYASVQGSMIVGDLAVAAALYPAVAERADRFPVSTFDLSLGHRIAGMAATAARVWDAAEEHFARARRRADELPNSVDRPQVLHWHARMLLDRGDPADRPRAATCSPQPSTATARSACRPTPP